MPILSPSLSAPPRQICDFGLARVRFADKEWVCPMTECPSGAVRRRSSMAQHQSFPLTVCQASVVALLRKAFLALGMGLRYVLSLRGEGQRAQAPRSSGFPDVRTDVRTDVRGR